MSEDKRCGNCQYWTTNIDVEPCKTCIKRIDDMQEDHPLFIPERGVSPTLTVDIIPRQEFIAQRLSDVANAIARYAEARMDIPAELMSELDEWWKELR